MKKKIKFKATQKIISLFSGCILLVAASLPAVGYAVAAESTKMCYNFATVSGHRDRPQYEANDAIVVLDVIPVPLGTAYNPTLDLAAHTYVKNNLKRLGLQSVDISSVFIGGGCSTGNENANQVARKRHLNDLEGRLLPNLDWLNHVSVLHGNWFKKVATDKSKKQGDVFRDCPDCPEMVVLPESLSMGKTEVTQGQWKAVMGNNPSKYKNCGDECPVEQVSWDDIQIFLQKLNAKTGKQYRLPTKTEWKYACFGGIFKPTYCGSNELIEVGWYRDNSNDQTHPVGQKQANGYGLVDMSGNVREWVEDCDEGNCEWHVLCGGSWLDEWQFSKTTKQHRGLAAIREDTNGFRLVRMLP